MSRNESAVNDSLLARGLLDLMLPYRAGGDAPSRTDLHDALYVAELVAAAPESGYHCVDPDTAIKSQTLASACYAAGAAVLGAEW